MAFGTGTNFHAADAGAVRGKQKEVACECWFTSTGKITPLMLKKKDDKGNHDTFPGDEEICRKPVS